jgi:hypothetical protein
VLESIIFQREDLSADMVKLLRLWNVYPRIGVHETGNLGSSVGITKCRSRSDLYEGCWTRPVMTGAFWLNAGWNRHERLKSAYWATRNPCGSSGEIVPGEDSTRIRQNTNLNGLIRHPADLPAETRKKFRRWPSRFTRQLIAREWPELIF